MKQKHKNIITVLDMIIILLFIGIIILSAISYLPEKQKYSVIVICLFTIVFLTGHLHRRSISYENQMNGYIRKIVMISEEDVPINEWNIMNKTSLLIGKNSLEAEKDIDLSDSTSAKLISNEHAVLNFSNGKWYLEDLDSTNGTGIHKANRESYFLTSKSEPIEIEKGDMISIADVQLLVQ